MAGVSLADIKPINFRRNQLSIRGGALLAEAFQEIPTGNTNTPFIMVGERAAEFILQVNP